ncbi:MAG: citrate/2-methylcitrate synthase [Lachnospiraceae bacterium]|jgi:citrate synthase|nr:citrate/2-methylcitrate synthase [Lachnospiraceae bacterium]
MDHQKFSEITPELIRLATLSEDADIIDTALFTQYDVKRGLRDLNGKGVLAGLTTISDVRATEMINGESHPAHGRLFYRGYDVKDLVHGFTSENRFGFEEVTYLLLFNKLPNEQELKTFQELLSGYRSLPTSFVRDIIMKAPSKDMMNTLARSVLTMYSYDDRADDTSLPNVLRQCLQLISIFPLLTIYGYQAYSHYHDGNSLYIHQPQPHLSAAENILHILRPDSQYTQLEARILDVALVLHMEHGGGNNSSFTTHVVTSSLADTYSVIAAAIGSLKGPRHGGANIKVVRMFDEMMSLLKDWEDEEEVAAYLKKLLHKEAFDHAGLIYGVGHAVYSKSDPRAVIFKNFVEKLSVEKGLEKEFNLYSLVEKLAPQVIAEERQIYKGVSVNVDFYSGFVYKMLGLPQELFTPIFAIARIVGWSAHRMEELANNGKIIRPAYKPIGYDKKYAEMEGRK